MRPQGFISETLLRQAAPGQQPHGTECPSQTQEMQLFGLICSILNKTFCLNIPIQIFRPFSHCYWFNWSKQESGWEFKCTPLFVMAPRNILPVQSGPWATPRLLLFCQGRRHQSLTVCSLFSLHEGRPYIRKRENASQKAKKEALRLGSKQHGNTRHLPKSILGHQPHGLGRAWGASERSPGQCWSLWETNYLLIVLLSSPWPLLSESILE